MDVQYERCCGIDVHKKTVVACVIVPGAKRGEVEKETQTYATMADDLGALERWLQSKGVTHIAMESTGVYWKPVFNLLEGQFAIVVVNAERIKALRGRKTDVADAEWIADLLRHGLLPGSFIPSAQQRALRDLTRFRTSLVNDRVRAVNRLQKTLEDANLKLASVVSDVTGVSARTKKTYLSAHCRRLAARRGNKRAIMAVGPTILTISYHLLTRHTTYQDLGPNYYDERDREGVKRRAVRRLEQLGYQVVLSPSVSAST